MSVHPDYCVSTQILDRLMEITLKNGEYLKDGKVTTWMKAFPFGEVWKGIEEEVKGTGSILRFWHDFRFFSYWHNAQLLGAGLHWVCASCIMACPGMYLQSSASGTEPFILICVISQVELTWRGAQSAQTFTLIFIFYFGKCRHSFHSLRAIRGFSHSHAQYVALHNLLCR